MEKRCIICGNSSRFKYYNVQSCESCKQFFRRIVVKHNEYHCGAIGKCDYLKGEKCRSCRLDKCLRLGMDPSLVVAEKTKHLADFLTKLEQRRRRLYEQNLLAIKHEGGHRAEEGQFDCLESTSGGSEEIMGIDSSTLAAPPADIKPEKHEESMENGGKEEKNMQILPAAINFSAGEGCVESLVRLVCNHRRIWGSATEYPSEYPSKHANLGDFLADPNNLLGKAEEFSLESPPFWDKQRFMEMTEQFGFFFKEKLQTTFNETFLFMEFAKSIPFFRKLEPADQIELLKHTHQAVIMFFNSFYSVEMNANTWTRTDGMTTISPFVECKRFNGDKQIKWMATEQFCNSLDPFREAKISVQEFSLLICLLFTNTVTDDISEAAKSMLYDESVRISGILMRMLHRDHGNFEGSKRFAAAINLLNTAYKFKYANTNLCVYLGALHRTSGDISIFPSAQIPLWRSLL